MPKRISSAIL
jgi:hypothetical protein